MTGRGWAARLPRYAPVLLLACTLTAVADEVSPPNAPADEQIEEFLLNGIVVEMKEIGTGITRPKKALLERNGRTMPAAFKTVDIQETGLTRFASNTEINFSDRYKYEIAAYLLDRELEMGMVPVAVERKLEGDRGALIEWVTDAFSEHERREQGLDPPDVEAYLRQRQIMKVFDVLIANTDRNLQNQLIRKGTWELKLIDHSRSFRMIKRLPDGYEDEPISLPSAFYEKLQSLEEKPLVERMRGVLNKAQVKALLARRDRIVAKVERDRGTYGDAMVFPDRAGAVAEGS